MISYHIIYVYHLRGPERVVVPMSTTYRFSIIPLCSKPRPKVTRKDAAATAMEAFRTAFSWRSLSITWATKGLIHQQLRWLMALS